MPNPADRPTRASFALPMTAIPVVAQKPQRLVTSAAEDFIDGLRQWPLWSRLSWLEIKRRYRRTVIGPFWSVINLTVMIGMLGGLAIALMHQPANEYLPYLASGMVVWLLLTNIINESCLLFVNAVNLFRQTRLNYSILVYSLVYRNLIVFCHHLVVYLAIMIVLAPGKFSFATLLALPGLALVLINGVWISLLLGMVCLRFRDLQQLVGALLQIGLFVTPIFWSPNNLEGMSYLFYVTLNPIYQLISIVRAPMLGELPTLENVVAVLLIAVVGYVVTYAFFSRFRRRIAYWS